jgi:hypothetical protein
MRKPLWGGTGEKFVWAGLMAAGFCLVSLPAVAQDQKPDSTQIVLDFMRISNANGELNLVFWIPEEFWTVSAKLNPKVSQSQMDVVIKVLHPYTIAAVVSGTIRPFATPTYRTEAEVRELVRLKDSSGNAYSPLPQDQLDPSTAGLLALLKPLLGKMAGGVSENMQFCVFPGTAKDGARICDPMKEGSCEVDLGGLEFKWRLPLGSLLPKQRCPLCGEILSGAYKYCPYDGTKLAGNK